MLPLRNVLICDDNPLLRTLLANAVLEVWPNSKIWEASNGIEGEELVQTLTFDVIFIDLEMPKQNGLETIRKIRQNGLAENTPIVLCTGCTGDTALAHPVEMADFRITKPFELQEIDNLLDHIKWRGYSLV